MNYWLTTQFPALEGRNSSKDWSVWLPHGRQRGGIDLKPGDQVFIYESKTGRTVIKKDVSGNERKIRSTRGRQGVVALVEATTAVEEDPSEEETEYAGGEKIWWKWKAQTKKIFTSGFVPLKTYLKIMGHSPKGFLKGYGESKSGLKKLTKEQFDQILTIFNESSGLDDSFDKLLKAAKTDLSKIRKKAGGKWGGKGGREGNAHLHLKNYIAANPCLALNEDGMEVVKVEYHFSSGDRADILLKDRYGQVLGLEVETNVKDDAYGMAGVLQAVKYRFMGALTEGNFYDDSRSILVAYSISRLIKKLCKKYEIETVEVPQKTVNEWVKMNPELAGRGRS